MMKVKVNRYVEAVKRAIRQGEKLNNDLFMDKWRLHLINPPKLSNFREI